MHTSTACFAVDINAKYTTKGYLSIVDDEDEWVGDCESDEKKYEETGAEDFAKMNQEANINGHYWTHQADVLAPQLSYHSVYSMPPLQLK
jgi:hypothetical protein